MTPQDPATQLDGWLASKAVEAIVSRAAQPIAARAGAAIMLHGRRAVVRQAKAKVSSLRRRT